MTDARADVADVADVAGLAGLVDELVGDRAGDWDRAGRLPTGLIHELGSKGVLCAQVPAAYGGPGLSSVQNGELTAHVGSRCSSLRSLMTSHGMAAWTVQRFGSPEQRAAYLSGFTSGDLAAVAFSEADAGSDLSGMSTLIVSEGDTVRVNGAKVWITGADYASHIMVFGRFASGDEAGAGALLVPADHPGVTIERVPDPLGCRAAGHANVTLRDVRLPADSLLAGAGLPLDWLVTAALTYGRLSIAWGCVGIVQACLGAAVRHTGVRRQFGQVLAAHQLVARRLADMVAAEQASRLSCAQASRWWDEGAPDLVTAAVTAKYLAAGHAAETARSAVQLLASAGAQDGHVVARAYRDAKMMELIEGSTEISQLLLAERARVVWA
ncbi:acyl-CoA dehydrogenase family protein [Kineosporia sp. J2-2]|uniref:Acyl-CoA dehydrogenase family protein n=1 Tax=Kineosporia corallincola TaxID=2835133 RepID=A0ABS5TQX9_9ACTN|nr:acyl-CoA dehydrogenase family protein [Kineosporia corallincola]MBT0772359.1 acyl-CoA dehydrogenase family protein [Kineosporia corallincola]